MTRDDIIRMAREAELHVAADDAIQKFDNMGTSTGVLVHIDVSDMTRFAALVAAHVRETEFKPDWNNFQQGLVVGAAEEREACAALCDAEHKRLAKIADRDGAGAAAQCAYKIRAQTFLLAPTK